MFRSKTDAQWAYGMGIDLDLFLGKRAIAPLDTVGMTCGDDDAAEYRYNAITQMIQLRKEWGEDTDRCELFRDYVTQYWVD